MSTQIQAGHAVALTGALVDLVSGAYYSTRANLRGGRFSIEGKWEEVEDQGGEIGSLIITADYLQAEFDVLPEHATTRNGAFEGSRLPARGTGFNASGFGGTIHIPLGPFLNDGLNSTGSGVTDTQPWIFMAGELTTSSTEKWMARWTMRRYKNITSATAIT